MHNIHTLVTTSARIENGKNPLLAPRYLNLFGLSTDTSMNVRRMNVCQSERETDRQTTQITAGAELFVVARFM